MTEFPQPAVATCNISGPESSQTIDTSQLDCLKPQQLLCYFQMKGFNWRMQQAASVFLGAWAIVHCHEKSALWRFHTLRLQQLQKSGKRHRQCQWDYLVALWSQFPEFTFRNACASTKTSRVCSSVYKAIPWLPGLWWLCQQHCTQHSLPSGPTKVAALHCQVLGLRSHTSQWPTSWSDSLAYPSWL